jgi:hypothetical protein
MERTDVLREMIAEKQRQIELYTAMVHEWQKELGESDSTLRPSPEGASNQGTPTQDDPVASVRKYQFFNKSQPEAAKLLLEYVTHPLSTQEIVTGIEKGGVTVGGKTPKDKKTNLYTILQRSDDFVRFKRDTWGLAKWPGAPKKTEQDEEKDKEKTSGRAAED